jgi:rubredoxin
MTKAYSCPVCGYPELEESPYYPSDQPGVLLGSHEICPSCGYEFGYADDDLGISHEEWRKKWISTGMRWRSSVRPPPPGWDPVKQLREAGLS